MTVHKLTQHFEITIWGLLIPLLDEKGPLMKTINMFRSLVKSKYAFKTMLVLVWAAVGFISGLLLGKLVTMLQLL